MTKAEQETTIRWDQEERVAHLWTAYEPDARAWRRAGFRVHVFQRNQDGLPVSWWADVPVEAIRWRRMEDGAVVKRRGHTKGRLFGLRGDELVVSEPSFSLGSALEAPLEQVPSEATV
jgi:hypothetical protein